MRNGRDSELTSFYQEAEKRRDIVGGSFHVVFSGAKATEGSHGPI